MAKNDNLQDFVTAIGNAIKTKKGISGTINAQNFDSEILSIESMPTSTKELAKTISGEVATDETTLNNAIAKGATDTPETATFAERTTADGGTIKDTIARIDKVKGNCVKFCQHIKQTPEIGSAVGKWNAYNAYTTISVEDGVIVAKRTSTSLTFAQYVISSSANAIINGHTYLMSCMVKTTAPSGKITIAGYGIDVAVSGANSNISSGDWQKIVCIRKCNTNVSAYNQVVRVIDGRTENWDNVYFKDFQLFDLTAMGIDTYTTADQVAQYLGYASVADMPYLPYQSDTIVLTNSQNSVTSKSRNLWDEQWELGSFDADGGEMVSTQKIRSKYIPIVSGKTYYRSMPNNGIMICYDSDKNVITPSQYTWQYAPFFNRNTTFQVPANTSYIRFSLDVGYGTTYNHDVCINVSDSLNGTYSPYMADDNLPTNARNLTDSEGSTIFPNGMQSNGSTYDEWDMAKGKVVKRIANDGTILATPLTYNVPPQKAYYKVSQNGKEIANSTELSAPFKADIAYRGMSAEELINELNG